MSEVEHVIGLRPKVFDLELAVHDHTIWKSKLRLFLDGNDTLSNSEATSSKDCALGRWLYAHGKAKYSVIPEIIEMEGVHTELHETVTRAIEEKVRNKAKAEELFSRIEPLSDRIVSLLLAALQKISSRGLRGEHSD
jgi:methyl-accepting chemotaxis protein